MVIKKHYTPPTIESDEIEHQSLLAGSPNTDWMTGERGDDDQIGTGGDDNGEGGLLSFPGFSFDDED